MSNYVFNRTAEHMLSPSGPLSAVQAHYKMRTAIFVLAAIPILTGCVPQFAKSPPEFRSTAHLSHSFVTELPLSVAYERIVIQSVKCHQGDMSQTAMIGSSFVSMPTGDVRVHGHLAPDHTTATVSVKFTGINAGLSGFVQVIDLAAGSEPATHVTVHQLNDTKKWSQATQAVEKWLQGADDCLFRR